MPSPEKQLTGKLTPPDEKQRRAVSRDLKKLGSDKSGKMGLQELKRATFLFDKMAELYPDPKAERDFEYFKQFEMEEELSDLEDPSMLTDLGDGFIFRYNSTKSQGKYSILCIKYNVEKGLHWPYTISGVEEVNKIVRVGNLPAVEMKMDGRSAVFYAGESVDPDKNYSQTFSPVNINDKLAYVALTKSDDWKIVVDDREQNVPEDIGVENIKCLDGKLLIVGYEKNTGEYIYYYDNKKVEIDPVFETASTFFFPGSAWLCGAD